MNKEDKKKERRVVVILFFHLVSVVHFALNMGTFQGKYGR